MKNRLKFIIAIIIELAVITAYVSSIFMFIYKKDQKIKKVIGKSIIYSSNLSIYIF
jgi:hypothetical protein